MYGIVVGEIGIEHNLCLYELNAWQIHEIIQGYYRRNRDMWSSTRWSTYQVMAAQVGSDGLRKAHINSPKDLMPFPWEDEDNDIDMLTEEDVEELKELMNNTTI